MACSGRKHALEGGQCHGSTRGPTIIHFPFPFFSFYSATSGPDRRSPRPGSKGGPALFRIFSDFMTHPLCVWLGPALRVVAQ